MMCIPCRKAGRLLTLGRKKQAAKAHAKCEHPSTCTCQHDVSASFIQLEYRHDA